jgi:hypothetical protein
MEPQYGMLFGALEQLASDRRRDLQASARPRRTVKRPRRTRRPMPRRLAEAIGLRPAAPLVSTGPCASRSA